LRAALAEVRDNTAALAVAIQRNGCDVVTYRAACQRWPGIPITLRQGARVIEDSRRQRVV
jgi:hypothetical protein